MRSVEVEGDSIDQAIQKALAELGIERDRAAIEILNDASRGILGFGGRKARVRASVRAPLSAMLATSSEVPRETTATTARLVDRDTVSAAVGRVSREITPSSASPRGSTSNIAERAQPAAVERTAAPQAPRPAAAIPTEPIGDLAARAHALLRELMGHLGVEGEVSVRSDAEAGSAVVALSVRGPDSALLIGKRGQTLDAIEYVLNRMLDREPGSGTRIDLDIEDYRERREESLAAMARRMAEKVRNTGRPVTLDVLSPRERRAVHVALRDEPGVTSRSQGEGFLRKLVILPEGRRRSGPRPARDGE